MIQQNKRRTWYEADNQKLIELWYSVGSVALISIMMQRSQSSIQTQASRLNLPARIEQCDKHRRKWTDEDDSRLNALTKTHILPNGNVCIQSISKSIERSVDAVIARLAFLHGEDSAIIQGLISTPTDTIKQKPSTEKTNQEAASGGKIKKCLKCRKSFHSEGKHNWICPTCKKNSGEWDD